MSFITDKELRSYLLGTLADEPREQIEDTLLISDEGFVRLEMAEEDLIEEFLDGELDSEQQVLFESHFLCTKARKEKLAYLRAIRSVAAQQAQPEPLPGKVISFPAAQPQRSFFVGMNRSEYLKLAAVILLVSSVGFLIWRYAFRPSQSASLVALNRAYAGGRTLETRIGGLDYAPYAPTRGANDADTNARIMRERAALIVLTAYEEHRTAANRHALGKYYLADKQFDKAIEQFNAALKETPTVAELHNDLGAALLEKSKLEKRNSQPGYSLEHMAASLESIEQALKLQPNYPAAVFNRALCLQEMYLPRQAIEEWKKYLQLDSKSPWADEARRRLAELEKLPSNISKNDDELYREYLKDPANEERAFDLFCQSYSTTGNGITERLIDQFLATKQNKDEAGAAYKLKLLQKLGALVFQRTTDPYVRDVAHYYGSLNSNRLPNLIHARKRLNEGRQLRSTKQSEAEKQYKAALSVFRQSDDKAEALMTIYLLGRLNLRQKNLRQSYKLFSALTDARNSYLWLKGESLNGVAEFYASQSMPDQAIHANRVALEIAQRIANTNQLITNATALSLRYGDLGNWEESLLQQARVLVLLSRYPANHQQFWFAYSDLAVRLQAARFYQSAIAYQQEALNLELKVNRKLQLSRSYTELGLMLGQGGRFAEAISAVQAAINLGVSQGEEKVGLEIQAFSGLALADIQSKAGQYEQALQSYKRVIELNQKLGNPEYAYEIFLGKAITEIALGHTQSAQNNLTQALTELEHNRNQISAEKERTTFFDKEYEAYDIAVGFASTESARAAYDLSEKSRARSLLEAIREKYPAQTLTSSTVQTKLPSKVKLLEFACLSDRLLIWGISSDNLILHQQLIPLSSLEQKVQAFLQALAGNNPATSKLSAELYQILLEPLEPFVSQTDTLCIVPDKILHHLPFAALFSIRQQQYLVENHAIIVAPSASVFLACSERAYRLATDHSVQRLLAVGNPLFDQSRYPQLDNLSAAESETGEVAKNYAISRVLNAEQATEQTVKAELKRASIVHLATHGVIDQRIPDNSRLLLTKPTNDLQDDGALRAYELAQMHLPQVHMAVLSACQSGVERYFRGEGMIGLSRAFLASGVPTVVASFWTVNSEATATLMTAFHRQLRQYPAPQALRMAQLSLLNGAREQFRSPYYWAAFSTFGGAESLGL